MPPLRRPRSPVHRGSGRPSPAPARSGRPRSQCPLVRGQRPLLLTEATVREPDLPAAHQHPAAGSGGRSCCATCAATPTV